MRQGDRVGYLYGEVVWPATVSYVGFTDIDVVLDEYMPVPYGFCYLHESMRVVKSVPISKLRRIEDAS